MFAWILFIAIVGTLISSCIIATCGDDLSGIFRTFEAFQDPTERELLRAYRKLRSE